MSAFEDDDEFFGDSREEIDKIAPIRQGRAKCALCKGKGVLDEGQFIHEGRYRVWSKKKNQYVMKSGERPSIHGETCPKCFGLGFSNQIVNQKEAQEQGYGPVSRDIDESIQNFRRAMGLPFMDGVPVPRSKRVAPTYDGRGPVSRGESAAPAKREMVVKGTGGMKMRKDEDGMISLRFKR